MAPLPVKPRDIPNLITGLRILLVAPFLWLLLEGTLRRGAAAVRGRRHLRRAGRIPRQILRLDQRARRHPRSHCRQAVLLTGRDPGVGLAARTAGLAGHAGAGTGCPHPRRRDRLSSADRALPGRAADDQQAEYLAAVDAGAGGRHPTTESCRCPMWLLETLIGLISPH
jgi:hypothetical protein